MMHYGFCRKHADQTGEGGCPECAMDHQQSTIKAMTETAAENSRVHIEMHNQIVTLQAEVARLTDQSERMSKMITAQRGLGDEYRTRIAELEAKLQTAKDAMETDLIYVTSRMDEHPEGYEGACWCRSCCSYATDDGEGKP